MPLDPLTINSILLPYMQSSGLTGTGAAQLSLGLSNGLSTYLLTGVKVATLNSGSLGVGTGIGPPGSVILTPAVLYANITAGLLSFGVKGTVTSQLSLALSGAIPVILAQAMVTTLSPIVGVGYGVGTLVPTNAYLPLTAAFKSSSILGTSTESLALGIGQGIDASLPSTVINIAIFGTVSPAAATCAGSGTIY